MYDGWRRGVPRDRLRPSVHDQFAPDVCEESGEGFPGVVAVADSEDVGCHVNFSASPWRQKQSYPISRVGGIGSGRISYGPGFRGGVVDFRGVDRAIEAESAGHDDSTIFG